MDQIIFSTTGYVHFITATLALVFGTWVLIAPKGKKLHIQLGYGYLVSMVVMLITSFMIYRLFDGFGMFHYFSIVSTVTLLGGMVPVYRRKSKDWIIQHFAFMYWSIMGLYAALAAEIMTRIPETPAMGMLGASIFIVMALASVYWNWRKPKWTQEFMGVS
ncbi:MAG: DUF2306 domain-containing protein [Bacteroidota bacterium]